MPDPIDELIAQMAAGGATTNKVPTLREDEYGNLWERDLQTGEWKLAKGFPQADPNKGKYISAPPTQKWIIVEYPDGTREERLNPNYQPPTATAGEDYLPPNTTAPYLLRKRPDGSFEQVPNPNYIPPRGPEPKEPKTPQFITKGKAGYSVDPYNSAVTKVYDFPEEEPSTWEREKWQTEQDQWKVAQASAEADRAAARRANLMNARVSLAGHLGNQWNQALPYAAMQGQQYHLAGAPGGVYENIARMSGRSFNPEDFRLQPLKFDGLAAWRAAQGMVPEE